MITRLISKPVVFGVLCLMLISGGMAVVQGSDGKPTATPQPDKPHLTPTPAPESTAGATTTSDANPYAGIPFSQTDDGAPVLGSPDAPITIIEFADYACSFCQSYEPTVQEFIQKYVATGRAKYEFRILPTKGGHMTIFVGSVASCMEDQQPGVFWPLHDTLYTEAEANHYNEDMLQRVAEQFGLNYDDALRCLGQHGRPLQAETDIQLARALKISGTPAIRVRYTGYYNDEPQYLVVDGQVHDAGGPPLNVLAQAVEDAEAGHIPPPEMTPETPILSGSPV